jgi:hypothetical protein
MEYHQLTSGHKLNFEILIVIMLFKISNVYSNGEFVVVVVVVVRYINQQTYSVNYNEV